MSAEAGAIVGRYDITDEHGHPVVGDQMPGRVILREGIDEASLARSQHRPRDRRAALVPDEGAPAGRPRRAARGQPRRGPDRDQEGRARAAPAERQRAHPGLVAGLRADAAGGGAARRARARRLVRRRHAGPAWRDPAGGDRARATRPRSSSGACCAAEYPVDPAGGGRDAGGHARRPVVPAPRTSATKSSSRTPPTSATSSCCAPSGSAPVMVVPMRAAGETLGALTFVSAESRAVLRGRRRWRSPRSWAGAPAMAVANARAFTERAQIARTLQASLLPPDLPEIEGWDAACLHEPAGEANDVGGDFFELFEVAGGWMAMIGDVEGKGARRRRRTAAARHTIHAVAQLTGDALTAVRQLDRRLRGGPESDLCSVALVQLRGDRRLRALRGPPAAGATCRRARRGRDRRDRPAARRVARRRGVAVGASALRAGGRARALHRRRHRHRRRRRRALRPRAAAGGARRAGGRRRGDRRAASAGRAVGVRRGRASATTSPAWCSGGADPLARRRLRVGTSSTSAKRPTRDSARSRRASERRKPCVTITWMRDCVLA